MMAQAESLRSKDTYGKRRFDALSKLQHKGPRVAVKVRPQVLFET
jgi:hypothetical protein